MEASSCLVFLRGNVREVMNILGIYHFREKLFSCSLRFTFSLQLVEFCISRHNPHYLSEFHIIRALSPNHMPLCFWLYPFCFDQVRKYTRTLHNFKYNFTIFSMLEIMNGIPIKHFRHFNLMDSVNNFKIFV